MIITDTDASIRALLKTNPELLRLTYDFIRKEWTVLVRGWTEPKDFKSLLDVIEAIED
jgi:hypothetical protein